MERLPTTFNGLWIARHKAGFRQKVVARLLGHRTTSPISEYERGRAVPSLATAFKLALIYRVPLPTLYPDSFRQLAREVEARRARLASRPVRPSSYAADPLKSHPRG